MVLSDFLSRQQIDDSNPHELIPISFSLRDQVSDYFYHIDNENSLPRKDKYLVQTRSQVRSSGIRLSEITWCKQRDKSTPQARKTKTITNTTYTKHTNHSYNTTC